MAVTAKVLVRVQVWDGDMPMMPMIMLDNVPGDFLVYPPYEVEEPNFFSRTKANLLSMTSRGDLLSGENTSKLPDLRLPTDVMMGATPIGLGGDAGRIPSRRLLAGQNKDSKASVLKEVLMHPTFKQIFARANLRRRADVQPLNKLAERKSLALRPNNGGLPTFFFLGRRIKRPTDMFKSGNGNVRFVSDMVRMSPKTPVMSTEVTLDLALNKEADLFLTTQKYYSSFTFAVRVESVELHVSIDENRSDGVPPSTYVCVEHGSTKRYSPIMPETRTPIFDWMAGAIAYDVKESLKVRVFIARKNHIDPEADLLVGQVWLPAPVVPVPRALAHPELLALSLGTNVGVVQLSVQGPAVRRKLVPGCVCWCGRKPLGVCGSPPCMPASSVWYLRFVRALHALMENVRELFSTLTCKIVLAAIFILIILAAILAAWIATTVGF